MTKYYLLEVIAMIRKRRFLMILFILGMALVSCEEEDYGTNSTEPKGGTIVFFNDTGNRGFEYARYIDLYVSEEKPGGLEFWALEKYQVTAQKSDENKFYRDYMYRWRSYKWISSNNYEFMEGGGGEISGGKTITIRLLY
jgi:hypothetical protein